MGPLDFIQDVMNPILDDDPLARVVSVDDVVLTQEPGRHQVVSTHTMVSGVDFTATANSQELGRRLLRIGLAKLASRGAQARDAIIMLALTEELGERWLTKFAEGLAEDLSEFGVNLVASDVRTTRGPNLLNMICIGHVSGQPMKAAGALPGDVLCVSGELGAAAIGARLEQGEDLGVPEMSLDRFLVAHSTPIPQWSVGVHLQSQQAATACVNIERGLVDAVADLAEASNVAVSIELPALPLAGRDLPIGPQISESADHQLLFTARPDQVQALSRWFPQVRPIGHVNAGNGVLFTNGAGEPLDLKVLLGDGPLE